MITIKMRLLSHYYMIEVAVLWLVELRLLTLVVALG